MAGGELHFKVTLDDDEYMRKMGNMQKGVNGLTFDKPVEQINRLKKEIEEVNDVLIKNRKSLIDLNNKLASTAPGQLKKDLQLERNSLKKSIQEDELALKSLNAELKRTKASHTTVNAELIKTRQQMSALAIAGKQNTAEYQRLSAKAKEYSNALKQVGVDSQNASKGGNALKNTLSRLTSYFGIFVGIRTAINLLRSFYDTTKQLDTINKSMNATAMNAEHLAANMEFLNRVTEDSGLKFTETAIAFNKFYAASKDKMSLNEIHMIFDKISKAAALMGMSVHDQNLIFLALEQMMSKGKVSSEELRRQLGERLPGAFDIMAKAVGVSTSELDEMMRKGEIISSEVLPKFALEVEKAFGAENIQKVENMVAAENRLSNAWIHLVDNMNSGEGTLAKVFMGFMDIATGILNVVTVSKQLSEEIGKEQVELNMLVGRIVDLNENNKKRGVLINQLKNTYPDFISFIKDEDFSNKNLLETLNLVNDNYRDRILLQTQVEKTSEAIRRRDSLVQKQSESLLHAYRQLVNINTKYDLGLIITPSNIQQVISEMNNLRGSVSGLEKDLLKVRQPLTRSMEQFEKDIEIANNEVQAQEAFQEELRKSLGVITETERANIKQMEDYNQKLEERVKLAKELGGVEGKDFNELDLKGVNDYIKKIEKLNAEQTEADKKGEALAKKRMDFIFELQKAENDLTQSTLSGLDLELAKVEEVYQNRLKKAKELGANQKALNDIESLRVREIETVTYKADTEALKTSLEQQRKDYEDFENFKKQVGVEKAKEMYAGIIDVSKSYIKVLEDEMAKIDLSTATDLEKDRFNTLFKIYQDYNLKKQDEDRKSVENLINTTMSVTDKLRVLYEKYQSDLVELSKKYTGERLKKEEENLQKAFINESDKLSSEILDKADEFQMALEIIGASTRRQAQYQIDSLNKLLQSSNKLSDRQVALIKKTIGELNKVLIAGDDTKQSNRISQINKQIADTESEINRLQKLIEESSKQDFETAEQFASRMKVISDAILVYKERLESLQQDKLLATIEEVSSLSSGFDALGDSLGDFNENLGSAFKTIGDILKIVGQVGKLIEAVGDVSKLVGEVSGSKGLAIFGAALPIVGTISQMISEGKKAREQARAEFAEFYRNLTTAEYEYQQLIRQRRLASIEANQDISPYESLKQQEEELRRQLIESANEYQELMTTIMQEGRYISDVERDKQKNKEIYADFSNITGDIEERYAQLEKMFLEGRLEGDTLAWFESLKETKEELEALGYTMEDIIRMQEELVTGTTWSDMASQIADMFASGTNSAIEFANTMEDVIRNAIVAGFKARFIDEEMQNLFDMLAAFSEDGLTEDEISQFKMNYEKVFEDLNEQWERITDGLGFDFGSGDLGGSAKDGIKRITESQADRLTGILTGMQVDVIESRKSLQLSNNLLSSSLDNLIGIEFNTRRTYESVERIEGILQNNQQKALGL